MAVLTKRWIMENADWVSGFGGQFDKERFGNDINGANFSARKGFKSTLTSHGKESFENRTGTPRGHFLVKGLGWFDLGICSEEEED